mgnify:CR=1 FL=1
MLKGIAASAGISIARVYKLEAPKVEIVKKEGDPAAEVEKFNAALEKTKKDIEGVKERAAKRLSEEELAVFDAHLMMAGDPEFASQIVKMIETDKVNAEYAADAVATQMVTMFESMDNDYFRERAADIKDVTFRLKCNLLGLTIPDLTAIDEDSIIVAYDLDGKPVTAKDLQAVGAMAALLKDAILPNVIQTLEHTPALVHGGPFANIAHGCNSVRATTAALSMADYVVTEAGFGADLGAEKFFDIKCRQAGLSPDAVVLVATIRALKYNGGVPKTELSAENVEALEKGIVNLEKHIENLQKYKVPVVVTLNSFVTDSEAEIAFVKQFCEERGCEFAISEVWEKGGEGGIALAEKVLKTLEEKESHFEPLYPSELPLTEKIETVAKEIYGAKGVNYTAAAKKQLAKLTELGFGDLPVCMAKTQYSLSDDPALLGRPKDFDITVREAYVSAGAGFVVVLTGAVMTMPGLPKQPAAFGIDVDERGKITGLF